MNSLPSEVSDHIYFLQKLKYASDKSIAKSPDYQKKISSISDQMDSISKEIFRSLPRKVRVDILVEISSNSKNLSGEYMDDQIAGRLYKQFGSKINEFFLKWDEVNSALKVNGGGLNSRQIANLLADIPLDIKTKCTALDWSGCKGLNSFLVNGKSLLEGFSRLSSLNISRLHRITSLEGIEVVGSTLESLDISYCGKLEDISLLKSCSSLKILLASDCIAIYDLSSLHSEIEKLDLSRSATIKILPLSNFSKLKELKLAGIGKLRSLDGFSDLKELTYLDISNTGVSDLKPLSSLTKLTKENIAVSGCPITMQDK